MKSFLKIAGGVLLALALGLIGLVRLAIEIIGASTTPDDFAELKRKLPKMVEWLAGTPWPVPTILLILFSGLTAWLLITGTRGAVREEVTERTGLSRDDVMDLISANDANAMGFRDEVEERIVKALQEQSITPHPTMIFLQQQNQMYVDAIIGQSALVFLPGLVAEVRACLSRLDDLWAGFKDYAYNGAPLHNEPRSVTLHKRFKSLEAEYRKVDTISGSYQLDYGLTDLRPDEVPYPYRGDIEDDNEYEHFRQAVIKYTQYRAMMLRVADTLTKATDRAEAAKKAPGRYWMNLLRDS